MITVPVLVMHDPNKVIGSLTIDENALPIYTMNFALYPAAIVDKLSKSNMRILEYTEFSLELTPTVKREVSGKI